MENMLDPTETMSTDSKRTSATPFSKRVAKFVSKFDVKTSGDEYPPWITGSGFLPDSRLLLVDRRHKKLKLFDSDFKLLTNYGFYTSPHDLSVRGSEVAVAAGDSMVLFSIENDIKESRTFRVGGDHRGVAYISADKLAVSGLNKTRQDVFCVYNIEGNQLSSLDLGQDGKFPYHVTVDGSRSRAYVSTELTRTVFAIDLETNKILFTYKHEDLNGPGGMTLDPDGNLYICGDISQNIHQVSPQGDCIRILLSQSDNITAPHTIAIAPNGDSLIVTGTGEPDFAQVFRFQ